MHILCGILKNILAGSRFAMLKIWIKHPKDHLKLSVELISIFSGYLKKADIAELKHYIFEQDNAPDPILTITEGIKNFRKLRF